MTTDPMPDLLALAVYVEKLATRQTFIAAHSYCQLPIRKQQLIGRALRLAHERIAELDAELSTAAAAIISIHSNLRAASKCEEAGRD